MRNFSLLHLRVCRVLAINHQLLCKVPVLTVQLLRPRSSAVRLGHALQEVFHHLAGGARSLRGSVSRRWPRGERGARQRLAVEGEISTGGAARVAEYRPLLKHA